MRRSIATLVLIAGLLPSGAGHAQTAYTPQDWRYGRSGVPMAFTNPNAITCKAASINGKWSVIYSVFELTVPNSPYWDMQLHRILIDGDQARDCGPSPSRPMPVIPYGMLDPNFPWISFFGDEHGPSSFVASQFLSNTPPPGWH